MSNNDFFTIFVFPFKYERGNGGEIKPIEVIKKCFGNNNDSEKGWKQEDYLINSPENYNEYYYFHPFVRKAIFNRKDSTGIEYLTRTDYKCMEVEYFYEDKRIIKKAVMVTDIKSIDLHFFDNQIGLLTITTEKCSDDKETEFYDLLRYNDIARRVYPPFITKDKDNILYVKKEAKLLPVMVTIFNTNDEKLNISECFESIQLKEDNREIVYMSKIITELLKPLQLKENDEKDKDKIYFIPFTDDRMFVISYYADTDYSSRLTQKCCGMYRYELPNDKAFDEWYRFIFLDGNFKNIQNSEMQRALIQKHTYSRWADWKTLYGFSRYSLVMIGDNGDFCRNVLKQHMKSIYYQMALIVLFQRAMLLKFSDDIAELLKDIHGKTLPELREQINKLHGDFIKFINKYWFLEVTPQEQGIEMYNQWVSLLSLDKLYNEISQELSSLARYLENKTESETNMRLAIITIVGVPLAVVGVIIGFWKIYRPDIDMFAPLFELFKPPYLFLFSIILLLVVGFVGLIASIGFVIWIFRNKKVKNFFDSLTSKSQ